MKNIEVTEEELDFLNEIINIGVGNAADALEQLLDARIKVGHRIARQACGGRENGYCRQC